MRRLLLAAAAVAALAAPASARDYWNGSGFPLDHQFHSPYDNIVRPYHGGGYYPALPRGGIVQVPADLFETDRTEVEVPELSSERYFREQEAKAVAKAIHDERVCAPVTVYTDDGIIRHAAQGCRP
jgi:hypothetical protein